MKIVGKVIIEKFNTVTEETTSITEYNDICYTTTQLFLTGRTSGFNIAGVTPASNQNTRYLWHIRTSSYKQKQSKLNHTISEWSSAIASVGYPKWEDGNGTTTKDTFTVVAILYAPSIGTTRIINCVALDYNHIDQFGFSYKFTAGTSASTGTLTNLTLSTPCIQSDTEILSITYKLYFDNYQVEPLSEVAQSPYEYIRYIFNTATLYNQDSVPSFIANDGYISAATYNPTNCDSYSHHGIANNTTERYFNASIFASDNNKTKYIGAFYDTYTYNSTEAYSTGTFVNNLHIHSSAGNIWGTTSLCYKDILRAEQSPVQNIFKHKATCNVPFQSLLPSELSTMTGSISINHTNWVDELLPNNYRIKIVDSGNVGVATYKLEKLKLTAGFLGNTFCPRTAILPQDPANDHLVRYHIKSPRERTLSNQYAMTGGVIYRKLDETSKLFACPSDRRQNYFAVYDVITGNKRIYDSTNITGFGLTNISDADIMSNNIFISCANTGLWKVDLNLATATRIIVLGVDDTKCYAIATHSDGSIWALFEGGLGKSTDLGNTWTIYNPSSTPVLSKSGLTDNWSNCVQMVLDPTHVDYRFLFNLRTGTTTSRWIWWSTTFAATSPTSAPEVGTVDNYEITDSFKCHNNRFFINASAADTVGSLYVLAFGASNMSTNEITTNFEGVVSSGLNILPITVSGISGVLIQARATNTTAPKSAFFVEDVNLPVTATSYSLTSPTIEFFIRYGVSPFNSDLRSYSSSSTTLGASSQFAAYFEDSNFLVSIESTYKNSDSNHVTCLGCKPIVLEPSHPKYDTYKSGIWREYGWDGSNWVEGEVGAKTTHSTLEEILDGLQVSFADGATSPNFISTDFFNFIVGKGIMKDNATTVTFGIPYYPRRTEKISTFSSFIVPPVSPVSLLDEPVGFSTTTPNETGEVHRYIQNKGMINYIASSGYTVYSDQLIPASTSFTFRCKFTSLYSTGQGREIGMAVFSSGTTYSKSLYFKVETNGNVTLRNSSSTTLVTIPSANISIDTEFKIERNGANLISVSYNNNVIYTTTINSQYVVFAQSDTSATTGFYDCYLSYTENRPFVRVGDSGTLTGSYNPLFAGLTVPSVVPDGYIELDNIPQVRVHKTAGEVQNTGQVKVATGSGWLIFNAADVGKSIEGSFTAHYLY